MLLDICVCGVNLSLVSKGHDHKILVLALVISIHWRVRLAAADGTTVFNQINAFLVIDEINICATECVHIFAEFEIKTREHVEHWLHYLFIGFFLMDPKLI